MFQDIIIVIQTILSGKTSGYIYLQALLSVKLKGICDAFYVSLLKPSSPGGALVSLPDPEVVGKKEKLKAKDTLGHKIHIGKLLFWV